MWRYNKPVMTQSLPPNIPPYRLLIVPKEGEGMRLDTLLFRWFGNWPEEELTLGMANGLVTDTEGVPLEQEVRVHKGMNIHIYIPGIAPTTPPPSFPEILYEDEDLIVLNKPPGMLAHPSGNAFTWAVISLSKLRWPSHHIELVHRLDRDSSGIQVLTKNTEANRFLKKALANRNVEKEYDALVQGNISWKERIIDEPLGPDGGIIRIKRGIKKDGAPAKTTVRLVGSTPSFHHVRCQIHTGRTHQVRVHLASIGNRIIGDRLYGVPPEVFLHTLKHGTDVWVMEQTGAPRHALHASKFSCPHPNGKTLDIQSPMAPDMQRWLNDPSLLPLDQQR
jgi:23S rRNA pseudouridine1911/1915/1917 synthase